MGLEELLIKYAECREHFSDPGIIGQLLNLPCQQAEKLEALYQVYWPLVGVK